MLDRVRSELHRVATDLNTMPVTALAATILNRAQHDEGTRRLRDRLVHALHANTITAVEAAVAAGELRAAPAVDDLFDQLLGPLFARRLISGTRITDDLTHRVARDTLGPWLTPSRPLPERDVTRGEPGSSSKPVRWARTCRRGTTRTIGPSEQRLAEGEGGQPARRG